MRVWINFLGFQRTITGTAQVPLTMDKGAQVAEAFRRVKASYPDLPFSEESVLVAVNEQVYPMDGELKAEDSLLFLPYIGGG